MISSRSMEKNTPLSRQPLCLLALPEGDRTYVVHLHWRSSRGTVWRAQCFNSPTQPYVVSAAKTTAKNNEVLHLK